MRSRGRMFRFERRLCRRNLSRGRYRKGNQLSPRLTAASDRRSARTAAPLRAI